MHCSHSKAEPSYYTRSMKATGQDVTANEAVAASDNVMIAAPAGIAVVTVDGEATKVVVK